MQATIRVDSIMACRVVTSTAGLHSTCLVAALPALREFGLFHLLQAKS